MGDAPQTEGAGLGRRQCERSARGNEIVLGRKCRRRHLLAHPHLLGCDAYEMDETRGRPGKSRKQKQRKARQRIIAPGKNPDVRPGIKIMLHGQDEDLLFFASIAKLGAIGVLFPAHISEQPSIGGTKRDEIAAAAVIWTEDKFLCLQLSESTVDVGRAKTGAIPTYRHYFVVAQLRDSFDGIFKPRRETSAGLPVNVWPGSGSNSGRREKMKIDSR